MTTGKKGGARLDWKAVVGILISVALIYWVLRDVDLAEVWYHIRRADFLLLGAAVAVATSGFLVRALRWKILLHPLRPDTGLRNRFAATNIGFAANNLLPARVGEFARAWTLARLERLPVSGTVGSLVVERFLDAVAVFSLLLIVLLSPSFPADATVAGRPISALITLVVALLAGGITFLFLLLVIPRPLIRGVERLSRFLPERLGHLLVAVLTSFIDGLGSLRNPRLVFAALAWSIGFWAWNGVSFWLAFQAFGIDEGYLTALFVQAIIGIGVAIPSAPGFFGTFHAAAVVGLHEVYGAGEGATLAFAFGYHLGGFVPVTLIGIWYAWRLGLSWGELGEAQEVVEGEVETEPAGASQVAGP